MAEGIEIKGKTTPSQSEILSDEALTFLGTLERAFRDSRKQILTQRHQNQRMIDSGVYPSILPDSDNIRKDLSWSCAPIPQDLKKRWVEITGPTDKKMVINALNSGANVFMADFEDANSPTWENMVEGQANLKAAVRRTLSFENENGKKYELNKELAVLFCRPRGWHLNEKHVLVDGKPMSGSLFDFGLYFFHNAKELIKRKSGPYFYLPKLENHLEARLWNEVFILAQDTLGIPQGTIRATVLIETILAAFEMEEILWELKEHSAGLNAGRWDYIFSIIKKFHSFKLVLPDRGEITMGVPFMKAYANLVVRTCHKRNIHAMGGMSAFIPNRKDPKINKIAFAKVFEDKEREVKQGFDGTWVAHPDLIKLAREPFEKRIQLRDNQIKFPLPNITIRAKDILNFKIPGAKITEAGVRENINVPLRYIAAWLAGVGAVAINNLMEDAATAEISRSQLWQWYHTPRAHIENVGNLKDVFEKWVEEEFQAIQKDGSFPEFFKKHLKEAKTLLVRLVQEENFPEFLTTIAYENLE
ncbi:MAG: malate synthase A [Chlamydiia bacterium]|nr:malate synthase A [Chlamydiia bacterium]